jgi:hypothetical protein
MATNPPIDITIRTITLYCDCPEHKVEIEEFTVPKTEGEFLSIRIYNHRSGKTGKLFKKPILLGDVLLNSEQTKMFKEAFRNHE